MFKFEEVWFDWVYLIEPKVFWDTRWFFLESYNKKEFFNNGIKVNFVQDNHSKSMKGVFRWIHIQTINTQSKLVRVIKWSVLDFVLDLRKNSKTFWDIYYTHLSSDNKKQLFVPKWFGHWFLSLEDNTEFLYKCDDYYNPKWEVGIKYDDEQIWLNWWNILRENCINNIILSVKDKENITLNDYLKKY